MRRFCLVAALALATSVAPCASAQSRAGKAKARALFNAGVEAYKSNKFLAAAQAFLQAHGHLPKPELLFSAAQAFRRQFVVTTDEKFARLAIKYYRAYIETAKAGKRRLEAINALTDLQRYDDETAGAPLAARFPPRVSVTSQVNGAQASVDGGPLKALPLNEEIAPGQHRLLVQAPGYQPQQLQFLARKGETVPVPVALKPIQPLLKVAGADGASVFLDGKPVGVAPLNEPIEIAPGEHFVVIRDTGHTPYAEHHAFSYGGATSLTVDLPPTTQRHASYAVLGLGGASFVVAGVVTAMAFSNQSDAETIIASQQAGTIVEEERLAHNSAIETRDDLRLTAGVMAGVGGAALLTGALLYFFDEPPVPSAERRAPGGDKTPEDAPAGPAELEMMGQPLIGPEHIGFALTGRF